MRRGRTEVPETVAHLGELDTQGRALAKALAQAMGSEVSQAGLLPVDMSEEPAVSIQLNRVRLERGRRFGDVWLGWMLWRTLRLDTLLTELLPPGREAVPWVTMAAVLVLARFCELASELHIAEDWYRQTALEDILDVSPELINLETVVEAHIKAQSTEPKGFSTAPQFTKMVN